MAKSQARKQKLHTGRVQRKAEKKRKVQAHERRHGGSKRRSSSDVTLWAVRNQHGHQPLLSFAGLSAMVGMNAWLQAAALKQSHTRSMRTATA